MLNLVEETDAMEDWRAALGDDYAVTMSATLKETTFLTKILTVIDEVWRDVQLTPSSLADALHHGHDGTRVPCQQGVMVPEYHPSKVSWYQDTVPAWLLGTK